MVKVAEKKRLCYLLSKNKELQQEIIGLIDSSYQVEVVENLGEQISLLSKSQDVPCIIELHSVIEQAFLLEKANAVNNHSIIYVSSLSNSRNLNFLSCYQNTRHLIAQKSQDMPYLLFQTLEKAKQVEPWGIERCLKVTEYIRQEFFSQTNQGEEIMGKLESWTQRLDVSDAFVEKLKFIVRELLINTVVDAPARRSVRETRHDLLSLGENIVLSKEEKVLLQCGWDERFFGISVSDTYGTLSRPNVISSILKALREDSDKLTLVPHGLYEAFKASAYLSFNVVPSVKTEVIALIPLGKQGQIPSGGVQSISFFDLTPSKRAVA